MEAIPCILDTLFSSTCHTKSSVTPEAVLFPYEDNISSENGSSLSPHGIHHLSSGFYIIVTTHPISLIPRIEEIAKESGVTPPEMVFGENQVVLWHAKSGFTLYFNTTEALKYTLFEKQNRGTDRSQLQVKLNVEKKNTCANIDNKEMIDVKPLDIDYDWTYTSSYAGSLGRAVYSDNNKTWNCEGENSETMRIEATEERIDFEKLKVREPILWHHTVNLYEDELHDHGISRYQVRVRVMASGIYLLSQCWMRLDQVEIRVYETRIHHLFSEDFVRREYTEKRATVDELKAKGHPSCMSSYQDPQCVTAWLPVTLFRHEKLFLQP